MATRWRTFAPTICPGACSLLRLRVSEDGTLARLEEVRHGLKPLVGEPFPIEEIEERASAWLAAAGIEKEETDDNERDDESGSGKGA